MNTQNLLTKLFTEGNCLTYNWYLQDNLLHSARKMREQFEAENPHGACIIENIAVPLPCKHLNFRYFSNGALVIHTPPAHAENTIKQATDFLARHGYTVKQIFAPQQKDEWQDYIDLYIKIYHKACALPADEKNLHLRAFNSPTEFADYCFKNNNVLLTASKAETFAPKYRQMLALFANGLFVVDEKYRDFDSFYGDVEVSFFENRLCDYPIMHPIYVPHAYLQALYERATKYDWYIAPQDAEKSLPQITATEMKHIERILPNRTCISIITPRKTYRDIFLDPLETSPDYHRYVLFNDGKLVLSAKYYADEISQKHLLEDLKCCLPQMQFDIELLPDSCIDYLYAEIIKRQKSAHDTYIEMMRIKAEHISRIFGVPLILAQDAAAKFVGWNNFDEIYSVTEPHARHLIAQEQNMNLRAKNLGFGNSIYYNGLKYYDLLKAQNIPYENQQAFYQQMKKHYGNTKNGG